MIFELMNISKTKSHHLRGAISLAPGLSPVTKIDTYPDNRFQRFLVNR
jgi:hypothetical protein